MDKKNLILSLIFVIVLVISLSACGENTESEFYKNGIYEPEDGSYKITLPSEKWHIEADENPENITFEDGGNTINITRNNIDKSKTKDVIKEIPLSQEELEKQIRDNDIENYTTDTYRSTIQLFNDETYFITQFVYLNGDEKKHIIRYTVYDSTYLYDFNAVATDDDMLVEIINSIESFTKIEEDNGIKLFQLKDENQIENTYYSANQDYILDMPYGQWKVNISGEDSDNIVTTITRNNTKITIKQKDKENIANTIVYEIPTSLEILDKQIKTKGISNYEIIEFRQETVGTLPHQEDAQNYKKFSYLIYIGNNTTGKYYSYSEYRTESDTYILEGNENTINKDLAKEMYQVISSFSLTA